MTTSTPTPATAPTAKGRTRSPLSRVATLTRWNFVLLTRNRLAFFYAVILPLLPLALLFAGDRGAEGVGASAIVTVTITAGLFPVYYNVLSQFVSRRDELVLKRMRTGEVRDNEMLLGIALPGVLTAIVMSAAVVPIAMALGQPAPLNPALYAAGLTLVFVMFAAFAYWTAGWTKSAEAAQLTSLPVIMLAAVGPMTSAFDLPDLAHDLLARTPGAALNDIVRTGWFGFDGSTATVADLTFSQTWATALEPAIVLGAWTVLALWLASRSLKWEPRS